MRSLSRLRVFFVLLVIFTIVSLSTPIFTQATAGQPQTSSRHTHLPAHTPPPANIDITTNNRELDQTASQEGSQSIEVIGEPNQVINAPAWHAAGLRGAGVRVAIIDTGFTGYQNLIGSELPNSIIVRNFASGSIQDVEGNTNRGAAVAEVIHDIAPQASFYLIRVETPDDLKKAIDWLVTQPVDIINTSMGWLNVSPGDGTGFFAELVQKVVNKGIFWVTAGGDLRQFHWGGTGTFYISAPGYPPSLHYTGGGDVFYFDKRINQNEAIEGFLRWDDWENHNQDYDLYLFHWDALQNKWIFVANSTNLQNGSYEQTPTEQIQIKAPATAIYGFMIFKINSTRDDVYFELFTNIQPNNSLTPQRNAGSLPNLADVADIFTVSAVNIDPPFLQEPYSSEGPTNGPGGSGEHGLLKPDIAAYANITTTTLGMKGFTGTAAAAAQVSGAVALIKNAARTYTPGQIKWYLESRAIDLGEPGKDFVYGSGRLSLGDPAVFLTTPAISVLPNQVIAQNSTHSQAIDLWAFTHDAYSPDDQLHFSIDNTPHPDAGIRIVDNRYISLQPITNWTGQTTVTIRVTTPYAQTKTSQFTVTVLPPPTLSTLPNQVLPASGSLSPPVDLWAYSSDSYFPNTQLVFNLETSLDPYAGVTIQQNRYLHIDPLPDWSGQIQVKVNVRSPIGLTNSTTFRLYVLAPPRITELPDQFLPVNFEKHQAIDLWSYTYDVYIPVDQMIFSIDNNPAKEAGASLRVNRYIDIQPTTDWVGHTQVTIRVTTPYAQSSTAHFNVNVGHYKIWSGSHSQAWEEASNWIPVGVPANTESVIIPSTSNQPRLSAPAVVNYLVIEPNAVLDLGRYNLSVEGQVYNRGGLKQTLWINPGETSQFLHLTNLSGQKDQFWGVALRPRNEELLINGSASVTVTVLSSQFCPMRFSGVLRCFEIQVDQPIIASLTFYFSETEANNKNLENLVAFRLNNYWQEENGNYTLGSNDLGYYLVSPEQSSFGIFSLDHTGAPTHALVLPMIMNNFVPLNSNKYPFIK